MDVGRDIGSRVEQHKVDGHVNLGDGDVSNVGRDIGSRIEQIKVDNHVRSCSLERSQHSAEALRAKESETITVRLATKT